MRAPAGWEPELACLYNHLPRTEGPAHENVKGRTESSWAHEHREQITSNDTLSIPPCICTPCNVATVAPSHSWSCFFHLFKLPSLSPLANRTYGGKRCADLSLELKRPACLLPLSEPSHECEPSQRAFGPEQNPSSQGSEMQQTKLISLPRQPVGDTHVPRSIF